MKNCVWYLHAPGKVSVVEETMLSLEKDQVLIEVEACGICQYDYKLFTGQIVPTSPPYPHPHGHEAVGRIIEIGEKVSYCRPGDRVGVIGGFAFAEKMICRENQVAKVPSEGDAAVYITEPLTCVVQFVNNLQFVPGQSVVMFGLGYMGLLILQMLPAFCARVFAVEPRENIHSLAKECGADLCINPKKDDPVKLIRSEFKDGVDIVIDACGGIKSVCEQVPGLLRNSFQLPGSQWGFFSSPAEPLKVDLDVLEMASRGIRFVNSGTRDRLKDNRTAAALLSKGTVKQNKLITHRFKFQEVQKAMDTMTKHPSDWIKGVILMK
ncbi:MAG: alcohol dehydrogenase catalytic domain-containing protein [Kiritimatiellae bacterium]|nr:alcohol dehydrogenase catalytic domain-containing protein [Kiritimatiellia bacterium]